MDFYGNLRLAAGQLISHTTFLLPKCTEVLYFGKDMTKTHVLVTFYWHLSFPTILLPNKINAHFFSRKEGTLLTNFLREDDETDLLRLKIPSAIVLINLVPCTIRQPEMFTLIFLWETTSVWNPRSFSKIDPFWLPKFLKVSYPFVGPPPRHRW